MSLKRFVAVGSILMFVSPAAQANNSDAVKLYTDHKYKESVHEFETHYSATFKDPDAAYYYALSLTAIGQTNKAVKVCEQIVQQHPTCRASSLSKLAIKRWSQKVQNVITPGAEEDVGIVGLKFVLPPDEYPRVDIAFEGTPAAKELKKGDVIKAVEGVETKGLTKEEIYQMIVGKPHTKVSITVVRDNQTVTKSFVRMSSEELSKNNPELYKQYVDNR